MRESRLADKHLTTRRVIKQPGDAYADRRYDDLWGELGASAPTLLTPYAAQCMGDARGRTVRRVGTRIQTRALFVRSRERLRRRGTKRLGIS